MPTWFRVDSDIARNAKIVRLSGDKARWTYILCLAEGKRAVVQGSWQGRDVLVASLPSSYRRFVAELIESRLLDEREDGTVVIHDWTDWQSLPPDDPTRPERQARYRAAHKEALNKKATERRVASRVATEGSDGPSNGETERETETEKKTPCSPPARGTGSSDQASLPGVSPSRNGKLDWSQVDALVSHYQKALGKGSYKVRGVPNRERVMREAFKVGDLDDLKCVVDIFSTHKAYAFHRGDNPAGKRYDGLCEHVLAKGAKVTPRERIEEILAQGGYELEDAEDAKESH